MIFKENYLPISDKEWPKYDESFLVSDSITIAVQINGKTRGTVEVDVNIGEEDIFKLVIGNNKFFKYLDNMTIVKKIYVPKRLVNFVIS